jgi:[ribosomal protein S5]-alanine N-acetyltransferase
MRLEGERIYLTPLTEEDATDEYLSWLRDPEVMRGIVTEGYNKERLKDYISIRGKNPFTVFNKIILKENETHIGNIKLDFHDAKANVSELGLLIGNKNYWGKGLGHEACRLMIDYGFNHQQLSKIWLAVYGNNMAAIKLYKNLGFIIEGILKSHVFSDGVLQDKYLMAIFNLKKK